VVEAEVGIAVEVEVEAEVEVGTGLLWLGQGWEEELGTEILVPGTR